MAEKPSYELQFLKKWYAWAIAGGPSSPVFEIYCGLCSSYDLWLTYTTQLKPDEVLFYKTAFFKALRDIDDVGITPFGGIVRYMQDRDRREMHKNEQRLYWVKTRIELLERESYDG